MKTWVIPLLLATTWPAIVTAQEETTVEAPSVVIPESPPPAAEVPRPPSPGDAPKGYVPVPAEFAAEAGAANLFSLEACRTALSKLKDPGTIDMVRKFLDEHQKIQDELQASANSQQVPLRAELDKEQKISLRAIKNAPPDQFESVFLSAYLVGHQSAMQLYSIYGDRGAAGSLKDHAQSVYPTLRNQFLLARIASNE